MDPLLAALLLVPAGFVAGVMNVVAGGGSVVTLPALIAVGLPVHVANGTNRLSIAVQAIIATVAFRREGELDVRLYRRMLPSLLGGAVLGAGVATVVDPDELKTVFGVLFLLLAALLVSHRRIASFRALTNSKTLARLRGNRVAQELVLSTIGLYAGFIQAGAALLMLLTATGMLGATANRANSVKLPLILTFTLPAIAIFLAQGQVAWIEGVLLGFGTVLGSLVGVRVSLKGGERLVNAAVLVVLVVTGASLLGGR